MNGREPLVFVHGWGMSGRVFAELCQGLPAGRAARCPDLPGCGARRDGDATRLPRSLAAMADDLLAGSEGGEHWVGWSMGGLVALEAARRAPEKVRRVTLVAATPRMIEGAGWPGIAPAALAEFRRALADDAASTHERFLALQARGDTGARSALRKLRGVAAADGVPAPPALRAGLDLLVETDLRGTLDALSCPVHAVLGERDALVPVDVGRVLQRVGVSVQVIPGAGHAPFLSHPGAFIDALLE